MLSYSALLDWNNWILLIQIIVYIALIGLVVFMFLYKFWHRLTIHNIINISICVLGIILGFNYLFM